MSTVRRFSKLSVAIVGASLLQAGCGGASEFGEGGLFDQADVEDANDGGSGDGGFGDDGDDSTFDGSGSGGGALEAGPVTVSAEPGHAVVTVDGRTIDHSAAGLGDGVRCVFSDDQISLEVNSEHGTMVVSASRTDDGWIGRFTADSDEGGPDDWIQYSAQPFDGELGIDFDARTLSYVGTAVRQDRNAMAEGDFDTPSVDVTVAVNCGIEPAVVEVAGQTFTFDPFEADSMTCEVTAPDSIEIMINSLSTQDRQLQFSVRPDGEGVIGGVYLTEGDDRWNAVISTATGTAGGLSIDGATVTFAGTFEHTSDADPGLSEELDGTATVTCPG